jgi:hypothetical protein
MLSERHAQGPEPCPSLLCVRPRLNTESPVAHRVQSKLRILSDPDSYLERLSR